ncbi:zinc ribbon domain-containing protein [uncultured Parolsenella sp.]|uniref:zinc ribbon domain-containing protein n=1 Tax=uncultured Parolsenella sp. TaxID=2083008 RepID=UPI0025950251|nr:zinc ribbon domain-containing protein [uncultured Parolsenella sp.]
MRCPSCGSEIADGLDVCPACHANLSATRVMPKLRGTWCPSCGALVPVGEPTCPKCGMPVSATPRTKASDELDRRIAEERRLERERTSTLPRIESAIPSEPDPRVEGVYGRERLPHTKVFALAAIASLLVVGGAALVITHPWDPTLTDTRATTPADTSQAGFPGTVDKLVGQDSGNTDASTVVSADEATFSSLTSSYESLADLSSRADELESRLDEAGVSGSAEERAAGEQDAKQLALDVSNEASTIAGIDVQTTGTYTDQKANVATLASWLRNRVEAIYSAWQLSAQSSDPASDREKILSPMSGNRESDGSESYVNLFKKNYEAWKPEQR